MKTPKDSNEKDSPRSHKAVESRFYSAPHLLVVLYNLQVMLVSLIFL